MAAQPPPYEKNQHYPNVPPYVEQPMFASAPQPGPQQVYHHANVITTPVVVNTPVGPHPQVVTCPSCGQQGMTRMKYESHSNTHRNALIICICCCWPCACLPYCMNSCRNGNHYCKHCGAFIGTYKS